MHCDGAGFPAHEILPFIPAKPADHLRQPRGDQFRRIRNGEEAEIEHRIQDANRDQCSKWVAKQLVGSDGVLKPQEPMPLRVIWSADGPRTDPSMFSRAPDET